MTFIPANTPNSTSNKYDALVWLIIGQPMSGKSTFANSFPSPILINTDGNFFQTPTPYVFINKNGVPEKDAQGNPTGNQYNPWEYFKNLINELIANPHAHGYKTLILDLIEDLYEFARAYVCTKHKKKHEQDIGAFGQGYKLVEEEFMSVINAAATLREFGWNVIMLSHETIRTVKTIEEKTIETEYASAIRAKIENKLKGISHVTGRTDKIAQVEQTAQGPITKHQYVLNIDETNSIASNRLMLPFDKIFLSYEGWVQATQTINGDQ